MPQLFPDKATRLERLAGLEETYEALESQGIGANNPTHTAWAKYAVCRCIISFSAPASQEWFAREGEALVEALRLSREV